MDITIIPSLWFDGDAATAAEFYASVFPDSTVGKELTKFLEIARKAKEKEDTKPAGADQKE